MGQKEYWNRVADKKEFTTPFQFNEFAKYVGDNALILDVGCGYGRTLNELYHRGYKNLIGIDYSYRMIDRGHKQYPFLDLRIQKDKKMGFEDNSVDAVVLFAVLTCITKDDEQQDLIQEIYRILKPNGYIYVKDFLLNLDERNVSRYDVYKEKYQYGVFELEEGAVLRHHDLEYIKFLFSPFMKCNMEEVVYTTMNGNKSNGFKFIGRKE